MKMLILYHPDSEYSSMVENFIRDCEKRTSNSIEVMSLETPEGSHVATTYGIVDYPAELVISDDGQLLKHWQGSDLPTFDDVMGYLNN